MPRHATVAGPDVTPQVQPLPPSAASDEVLVDDVARVINRAYAAGEDGLWVDGTVRVTPDQVADAIGEGGMLVARLGGEVVGCARVRVLDETTADLGLVSVIPEQWGGGVGREVVRAAEDLMRSRGVATAQLELLVPQGWRSPHKERLRAWYTRLGYQVVGTSPFEEVATHTASQLATPCEFFVFRKPLTG